MSVSDSPAGQQRQDDREPRRQDDNGEQQDDPGREQSAEPADDPIVAQRRVRIYLRSLRLRSHQEKTQKQVATALDWSPAKLLRIEAGHVPIATSDLIALLTQYGITDEKEINDWVELARVSRKPTIRDAYRDILSKAFSEFVQHESYASVRREYSTKLVPGVLQIEEYTEAVLRAYLGPGDHEEEIRRRVQLRAARSERLLSSSKNRPELIFIIDEAAVRRHVGNESRNPNVMISQLEHLEEVSSLPNVTILIVPFSFGMYAALRGPFEMLEFPDPADLPMLYMENPRGDELIHEDFDEIGPYLDNFTELEEALKKNPAINFNEQIAIIIRELKRENAAGR